MAGIITGSINLSNIPKDKILEHFDKTTHKYNNYINKNLHSDTDELGEDKIVRILQNYFI